MTGIQKLMVRVCKGLEEMKKDNYGVHNCRASMSQFLCATLYIDCTVQNSHFHYKNYTKEIYFIGTDMNITEM